MNDQDKTPDLWQKLLQPLILILLTGVLAVQLPLSSKRPEVAPGADSTPGIQLDSRLWMDPFDAPRRDPGYKHESKLEDVGGQIIRHIKEDSQSDAKKIIFIAVMVDGGPYFESLEHRRRIRYAVISGLMAQGYIPEDRNHIRYLYLKNPFNYYDPQYSTRVISQAERQMPDIIPYEWYIPGDPGEGYKSPVMVLWLDESQMAEMPLSKLRIVKNLLRLGALRATFNEDTHKRAGQELNTALNKILINPNFEDIKNKWREAKLIDDCLLKPCNEDDPAKVAIKELEHIRMEVSKLVPAVITSPDENKAAKPYDTHQNEATCDEIRQYELTQESFILRLLGPEKTETQLLDTLQTKISESVPSLNKNNFDFRVIGPAVSDTLLAMLKNAKMLPTQEDGATKADPYLGNTIYSPAASISERILSKHYPLFSTEKCATENHQINASFKLPGFCVIRTNQGVTDDELAQSLIRELELRGVGGDSKAKSGIALIAEQDTLYGRSLLEEFKQKYDNTPNITLLEYGYYRGLDGEGAKKSDAKSTPGDSTRNSGQNPAKGYEDLMQNIKHRSFDFAYGDDQIDYLGRIATLMQMQERATGQPIRAIGLLGSDVYDKLLILQALKPKFPSAIFFTTELDARYFDRTTESDSSNIARNLIVASGQGLQSKSDLKNTDIGYSPDQGINHTTEKLHFRSSLQTEYFNAVKIAISEYSEGSKSSTTEKPIVFEIGRTKAHDLDQNPGIFLSRHVPYIILLFIELLFLAYLAHSNQGKIDFSNYSIGCLICLIGLVISWLFLYSISKTEEPLSPPLEGISIWPTEIIRAISIALGSWFWTKSWKAEIDVSQQGNYATIPNTNGALRKDKDNKLICNPVLMSIILLALLSFGPGSLQFINTHHEITGNLRLIPAASFFILSILAAALSHTNTGCSKTRYGISMFAISAIAFLITAIATSLMAFSGHPIAPYRGLSAQWIDHIILDISVAVFIALLATILATSQNVYDDIRLIRDRYRMISDDLNITFIWKDIDHIGSISKAFLGLVWYPFIIAALLLISRSQIFDNWPMPVGLAMIFLLSFSLLIGCVWRIRFYVNEVRKLALNRRDKGGIKILQPPLADEIRNYNEGAFGPILTGPTVGGLTILFGGAGLTEMIPKLVQWLFG